MLRHRVENLGATIAERAADIFDHVGLAPQRARHHQERALRTQAVHLLDNGLGRRLAEHDLVHGAENDTPSVHAVLPGLFLF